MPLSLGCRCPEKAKKKKSTKAMCIANNRQTIVFLHIQKIDQRVQRKELGQTQLKNDNHKETKTKF